MLVPLPIHCMNRKESVTFTTHDHAQPSLQVRNEFTRPLGVLTLAAVELFGPNQFCCST